MVHKVIADGKVTSDNKIFMKHPSENLQTEDGMPTPIDTWHQNQIWYV